MLGQYVPIVMANVIWSAADDEAALVRLMHGPLDVYLPGISRLVGVGQGAGIHYEGCVARHTARVIANLKRFAPSDPLLALDYIDCLAGAIHDLCKPDTRVEHANGTVTFLGHEARAAARVPELAARLGIPVADQEKLTFLVRYHGDAHEFPRLPLDRQIQLACGPFWRNLRLLQKADALACWLRPAGMETLPAHREEFAVINERARGTGSHR